MPAVAARDASQLAESGSALLRSIGTCHDPDVAMRDRRLRGQRDGGSDRAGMHAFPRIARLSGAASRHLLPKFAGFRIGAVNAGGAFPAFMRTRYSWSAVPMTDRADGGTRPAGGDEQGASVLGERPLGQRKRNCGLLRRQPSARARARGIAGLRARRPRRQPDQRCDESRSWRISGT
jgi:hypothetical protein